MCKSSAQHLVSTVKDNQLIVPLVNLDFSYKVVEIHAHNVKLLARNVHRVLNNAQNAKQGNIYPLLIRVVNAKTVHLLVLHAPNIHSVA